MASTTFLVVLGITLALSHANVIGHSGGQSGGTHGHGGFSDRPGAVSRRAGGQILPRPVEDLIHHIKAVAAHYRQGVSTSVLRSAVESVGKEATRIISMTSTHVSDEEVIAFASQVASVLLDSLNSQVGQEEPTLGFAISLLEAIADRVAQEPNRMFAALAAIEHIAGTVGTALGEIEDLFKVAVGKRQATGGVHIDHGPGGTTGGVHGSYSHTHSDGSKTSIGGHVDYGSHGGASGGISVSHTWRRRR